jgi:hypothetical protein
LSTVFAFLIFGFEFGDYPVFTVYPPPQIYQLAPIAAEREKISLPAFSLDSPVDNLSTHWTSLFHTAD